MWILGLKGLKIKDFKIKDRGICYERGERKQVKKF